MLTMSHYGGHPTPTTSCLSSVGGPPALHATTILVVRRDGESVIIGDGQVSSGSMVAKTNANKVRSLSDGKVLVGIAGSAADCLTMVDRFEKLLDEYPGQMLRAGVELAKNWRTDKYLRQLNAQMLAVDKDMSLTLDGSGNVMANEDVASIGSGGAFALSAAKALIDVPDMTAEQIGRKAMTIAADMCVYTNHNFVVKTLKADSPASEESVEDGQTDAGTEKTQADGPLAI